MAKKKVINADVESLKKIIKDKKIVYGSTRVIALMKQARVKTVYLSKNCPDEVLSDVESYKGDAEVVKLTIPNDELGTLCRKQFAVSVLARPND